MLKPNLSRIFITRGIKKPYAFLHNNGFTRNEALRLSSEKIKTLHLRHIERLCFLLNCTPNDLLEYIPDNPQQKSQSNILSSLIRSDSPDPLKLSLDVPADKIESFTNELKTLVDKFK